MNHLVFNGRDFADFSAQVLESNFLKGAERDVTFHNVLGRNGSLMTDNNRFKTFSYVANLGVIGNMQMNMEAMRSFLASSKGMCRIEESQTPNIFRKGAFHKSFAPDKYDHLNGTVKLEFTTQPQKWFKSGEVVIPFLNDGSLMNPTGQPAQPLIRVYGHGSFMVGSMEVTVAEHTQPYIDIDCEAMLCHYGAVRMGEYVSTPNHEYPVLEGTTGITLNGVTLEITPRWFTI